MNGPTSMLKTLAHAICLIWLATTTAAQTAQDAASMTRAMDALRDGRWDAAFGAAESAGPVARDIIEWHRLRAGRGDFDAVTRFIETRSDWPGLPYLRRRSEVALPMGARENDVIAYFAEQLPQSGAGSLALIIAHRAKGNKDAAIAEAKRAWTTHLLAASDETALLELYGQTLKPLHNERLDMLLWRDATKSAARMYPRVSKSQVALAKARSALRGNKKGVDTLVDAVPKSLRDDPGLLFERMQWRARKGRNEAAIELMLAQSPDQLGEPGRWAGWRRSFARSEMRAGRISNAYRLASEHGLTSGSSFADLEWLAGYLSLTYRNDPDAAVRHFLAFRGAVATPISLGRAGYWEGRAHDARGDEEQARLAYAFGAEYQTSFYGQLAAEKAGRAMDPALAAPVPDFDLENASFAQSSVFEAAKLLLAAGERNLAERFLTHLAESLSEADVARLGAYALEQDEPHLAVMIGKRAAQREIVVPFAYYPVATFGLPHIPVPTELALAIARRESEFDSGVTSGVGARGLMQVMPATAKEVAGYLDIAFSKTRLLNDPVYNARIGTAYLDELMSQFDGNIVMVSAGYNAGPSRPIRWMGQRGDPRRGEVDIVDWIEHIPFDETRNYVMRVAESIPVYQARLAGETVPIRLSELLVARPGHERQALKGLFIRPRARPAPLTD